MEQSIVSVRVGLSYDPLRLSSCSLDLFFYRTFLPPHISISFFLLTGWQVIRKNVKLVMDKFEGTHLVGPIYIKIKSIESHTLIYRF